MFDESMQASKQFLEFQRGVFKSFILVDALQHALIDKGILSAEEISKAQENVKKSDYVKNRLSEYDKAIKEIEDYEKMDLGDLFSSFFTGQAKEKSDDHPADP